MSMRLVRDKDSFQGPLDIAINEITKAVFSAGYPVHDSAQRVGVALDEEKVLKSFVSQIAELLKTNGFRDLPQLFQGSQPVPKCHHLTVGPWRGIFLVEPSVEYVVALVFSKEPHHLEGRLNEIVNKYPPPPDKPGP